MSSVRQRERVRVSRRAMSVRFTTKISQLPQVVSQSEADTWPVHVLLCVPRAACQIELNSRKLDSRVDDSGLLARDDSSHAVDVPKYSRKQNSRVDRAKIAEESISGNVVENFIKRKRIQTNQRGIYAVWKIMY